MKDFEAHMVKGIRAGSESAFKILFSDYYRPLAVFGLKYVENLEVSKEIAQELFIQLYQARKTLVISTSLKSYLYRAMRNRCLNYRKQVQNQRKHLDQYQVEQEQAVDLEAEIRKTELEHQVFQIVEGLQPQCRNIFTLSRMKGLSNQEIADKLGISKRTVETQISNALKTLRQKLSPDLLTSYH